jgi:vitamin B12 transporter
MQDAMWFRMLSWMLFAASWALPSQAQAPTAADPEEEEITITGRVLDKPVFSPFRQEGTVKDATRPAYVITKEEIKAQGARNIRETLKYLPGVLGDGTVGTDVNALSGQFIRGSNTGQVLILLDGRPINNLGSGGFDLSEITTDIVERVEVLPGGGSTLYGSDAIGGIINIITTRPQAGFNGNIGVTVGDLGFDEQRLSLGGKLENLSWILSYNRIQADGEYKFSIPEANFKGVRANNDTLFNNLRGGLELKLTPRSKLNFNVLYLGKDQGVPGGVPTPKPVSGQGFFNTLTDNNRKFTDETLLDLSFEQQLGLGNDSTFSIRVNRDLTNTRFDSRTAFAETLSSGPGGVVTKSVIPQTQRRFETRQKSLGFQAQHAWKFAPNQTITYGFDYRNTGVKSIITNLRTNVEQTNYDDAIGQGAIFGQHIWDISPNFRTSLGLRQDFSSLAKGGATSPSVGFKWSLGDTTLRGNYIRNFRTPTISNLFSTNPTNIGNPDLKPETGDSSDIGFDQKLGEIAFLRVTGFQNTISNVIAFQRIAPAVNGVSGTWTNIGEVRTRGIETTLNVKLARNVYAFANYTLNDPVIRKDSNAATIGKELRFAGADKLGLGLSYENPGGWFASLLLNSLSAYPTDNLNTESLPGYTTVDARILVPLGSKDVTLNAGVENIFDRKYQLFAGFPNAGRTFRVGFDWKF